MPKTDAIAKEKTLGFQEIAAEGKVVKYTREPGGLKLGFKDLHFGDGHRPIIDRIMDDDIRVRVTISLVDPTAWPI
ncbi:MAG: hypothetical protein ACYTAN_06900 [Planctomycetota bacterium]